MNWKSVYIAREGRCQKWHLPSLAMFFYDMYVLH